MSNDRKKIPDEGTTAPDARPETRPEVRPNSGAFEPGPASTMFDEHASEEAVRRAVSDQVLAQAETDPIAARAGDLQSGTASHVDIGPSGTDSTHLNLASALDDTHPTPMVNRHELELPRVKPVPIEPFDTTSPGALGGESEVAPPPTGVRKLVAAYARPKMARTLTFVPELGRPEIGSPRRQRGEPKQESLLRRIGLPAAPRSPEPPQAPGLWAFIKSSPTHMAAGVFVILALMLLGTVVVVKLRGPAAPAIKSRPLEAPAHTN